MNKTPFVQLQSLCPDGLGFQVYHTYLSLGNKTLMLDHERPNVTNAIITDEEIRDLQSQVSNSPVLTLAAHSIADIMSEELQFCEEGSVTFYVTTGSWVKTLNFELHGKFPSGLQPEDVTPLVKTINTNLRAQLCRAFVAQGSISIDESYYRLVCVTKEEEDNQCPLPSPVVERLKKGAEAYFKEIQRTKKLKSLLDKIEQVFPSQLPFGELGFVPLEMGFSPNQPTQQQSDEKVAATLRKQGVPEEVIPSIVEKIKTMGPAYILMGGPGCKNVDKENPSNESEHSKEADSEPVKQQCDTNKNEVDPSAKTEQGRAPKVKENEDEDEVAALSAYLKGRGVPEQDVPSAIQALLEGDNLSVTTTTTTVTITPSSVSSALRENNTNEGEEQQESGSTEDTSAQKPTDNHCESQKNGETNTL